MNPQATDPSPQVPQPATPVVPSASTTPPAVPIASRPQLVAAAPTAAQPGPAAADDLDIIEPEWISKTQQVIALNAGDPFKLANELNALKTDYLQKRYGRSVKVGD